MHSTDVSTACRIGKINCVLCLLLGPGQLRQASRRPQVRDGLIASRLARPPQPSRLARPPHGFRCRSLVTLVRRNRCTRGSCCHADDGLLSLLDQLIEHSHIGSGGTEKPVHRCTVGTAHRFPAWHRSVEAMDVLQLIEQKIGEKVDELELVTQDIRTIKSAILIMRDSPLTIVGLKMKLKNLQEEAEIIREHIERLEKQECSVGKRFKANAILLVNLTPEATPEAPPMLPLMGMDVAGAVPAAPDAGTAAPDAAGAGTAAPDAGKKEDKPVLAGLEYPWHYEPSSAPRRTESRIDQDGRAYKYAEYFAYYWYQDIYTKYELDDYWDSLPLVQVKVGSDKVHVTAVTMLGRHTLDFEASDTIHFVKASIQLTEGQDPADRYQHG